MVSREAGFGSDRKRTPGRTQQARTSLAQRPQPSEAGSRARGERLQEFKAAGIIGTLGALQIGVGTAG